MTSAAGRWSHGKPPSTRLVTRKRAQSQCLRDTIAFRGCCDHTCCFCAPQRVFDLGPDVYAPLLAAIIPVGGIIGGVGGGLAGDWLSRKGGRAWLTSGELCAVPFLVHCRLSANRTPGPQTRPVDG
jgi:hypothetical protein